MKNWKRLVVVLSIGLCGCGGGSDGLPISGRVTMDDAPLGWGQIYLHGDVDSAQNTHHAILEVRDGVFSSQDQRLPPGNYSVTISVHKGEAPPAVAPAEGGEAVGAPEATVIGQWQGTAEIKADSPLEFTVKKSELKPSEGR